MTQTTTTPTMTETSLTVSRLIRAPRAKVYEAFTDPTKLAAWYHPGDMTTTVHAFEAKNGGSFRLTMTAGPDDEMPGDHTASGKVLEVVPNERIVKTWNWEGENANPEDSRVTIELSDADGGTLVKLTHELLPNKESVQNHASGWEGCLVNLEKQF